jgi:hypothetical protein
VYSIKRLGVCKRKLCPLHRLDGESCVDDAVNDFTCVSSACRVGLDHGESAIGCHGNFFLFRRQKYTSIQYFLRILPCNPIFSNGNSQRFKNMSGLGMEWSCCSAREKRDNLPVD